MARTRTFVGIDCDAPARAGIVFVLTARLDEMCALRKVALDFRSPAGVHDMRVASRRLRGALADFMPHLKRRRLSGCLAEIRTIAGALGRVRDQDVAIDTLDAAAAKAPVTVAAGIRRFVDLRRVALEEARIKLVPEIDRERLILLKRKFREGLNDEKAEQRAKQKRAMAPLVSFRDVAASIIVKRLGELEGSSKSLYHPLAVKPLHDLRITAKHLRYALELFAPCWGQSMLLIAGKVAGLQSSLGKLHDCDVWLEDFGDVASDGADPNSDYRSSSVWLLRHFARLRSRHFGKALSQWHEWETEQFSQQLRAVIQPDERAGEAPVK